MPLYLFFLSWWQKMPFLPCYHEFSVRQCHSWVKVMIGARARAHINARARHYANLASCACVHAPYTPYKVPRWYTVFIFPRMPENYFYATNVSCTHRGKIMTHLFDLLSNDVYVRFYLFFIIWLFDYEISIRWHIIKGENMKLENRNSCIYALLPNVTSIWWSKEGTFLFVF